MSPYYYHLKFELYAAPDPTATASGSGDSHGDRKDIWVPTAASSIFDDLPSHARRSHTSEPVLRTPRHRRDERASERKFGGGGASAEEPRVIDCGAPSATASRGGRTSNFEFLSERQWRARSRSSPPPKFLAGIGPRTAAKDWRFGRVSIESFDLGGPPKDRTTMARGTEVEEEEVAKREDGATQHAAPAASLGPNLGGMGQATKGRYVPLETKNTEAGWGIVHLYREADESSALRAVPGVLGDDGINEDVVDDKGGGGASSDGDDGTILCIPAVPSYLSPGDFLGFIGAKWRGDVSHYRMVMTSRLSRYMVLMKFRDKRIAREWRKEFDGKPFDNLEVRHFPRDNFVVLLGEPWANHHSLSPRFAM